MLCEGLVVVPNDSVAEPLSRLTYILSFNRQSATVVVVYELYNTVFVPLVLCAIITGTLSVSFIKFTTAVTPLTTNQPKENIYFPAIGIV